MQTSQPQEKDPSPVSKLIQQGGILAELCKKVILIQKANDILAQSMPKSLWEHCLVANIENGQISIQTDSAIWGTQLRYLQQHLVSALNNESTLTPISKVKLQVVPLKSTPPKVKKNQLEMSGTSSNLIKDCAGAMTNEQLKKSLLKLAQNGKQED
jgi:hypothetical protein